MRRLMLVVLVLAGLAAAAFWFITIPATVAASALPPRSANLDNGKIMFLVGGCAGCHQTPQQEDMSKLGGGMELKTPFGTFYPPNISSDASDGLGAWSEAEFVTAMWKGTSPDRRHYFPVFPYPSYQHMKLDDVRDLFAYLKTLPAVRGRPRAHDLPLQYSFRRLLGGWKFLYLDGKPFTPDPAQSEQWNRGAYLANGPGHCAECHSPRNMIGGIVASQRFAGGPDPEGGDGATPNITEAGIGAYSKGDVAEILATGTNPDGDTVGGRMAAVVRSTGQLPPAERAAIAAYIKSLPPVAGPNDAAKP